MTEGDIESDTKEHVNQQQSQTQSQTQTQAYDQCEEKCEEKEEVIPEEEETETETETCPICSDPLQKSDQIYSLLCSTPQCSFNMCHTCTHNLLKTSNQGLQEASDGNLYSINLQCPSCRGGFGFNPTDDVDVDVNVNAVDDDNDNNVHVHVHVDDNDNDSSRCMGVSLEDVLALRNGMVQESLMGVKDGELNAKDLRCKYDVSDDKLMFRKVAKERYRVAKLIKQKKLNGDECGDGNGDEYGNGNGNYADYFGQDDLDVQEGFELKFMAGESLEPLSISIQPNNSNDSEQSKQSQKDKDNHNRIKRKIEHVENMLFQGLDDLMSEAERNYVIQLMTSGSTFKLCQAAQLFDKILAMNAVAVATVATATATTTKAQQQQQQHPSSSTTSPTNANGNAQNQGGTPQRRRQRPRPRAQTTESKGNSISPKSRPSTAGSGGGGGDGSGNGNGNGSAQRKVPVPPQQAFASSSNHIPRALPNTQTQFQYEANQRRQWSAMYPLPFRMPRAFTLPLNDTFDPHNPKTCPIRFSDDEVTLSFLNNLGLNNNNRKYSDIDYENRCKVVKDAFSYLSVSIWKKVVKRDCSSFLGADNILLGLEQNVEMEERQRQRQVHTHTSTHPHAALDEIIPWRRVIITHVDRAISRKAALRVGDVVTHLDGEVFDGNVEKLKFILESKRNEATVGGLPPSIEIVVNAEVSVAEVLRLRSFMARNQPLD